jgi:hypothetical protein
MKKMMIMLVAAVCAGTVFAQTMKGPVAQMKRPSPAERRAAILARTGGPIMRPSREPGVCFMNFQKRVPTGELRYALQGISAVFQMSAYSRDGKAGEEKNLKSLVGKPHVAVVAIVDEPGQPALLTSPDECWAKINVAALSADNPDEYKLKLRVNKEMWRAFAFVCGGCYTETPACLLKPARSLAELDGIKGTTIGPDSFLRVHSYLVDAKCTPAGMTSYRTAVKEGWAPAPTNDIQKAVWDSVKSGGK